MTKAKKHLGQNFLNDPLVIQETINAADISPSDTILEIGPGKGVLTQSLLQKAKEVIAVEIDEDLLPNLKSQFPDLTLVHDDALKFTPPSTPYKIVANIPYYITSPLLNHYLLEQFQSGNPPETIVFMVQKEVAEKILAEKGKHSVLSLQVHIFGDPELICTVPKTAFTPEPKVDSAVIKITVHSKPKIQADLKKLFWLIHMSFAQKRKKLTNNLANAFKKPTSEVRTILESLKIDPDIRAEALTLEEWERLYLSFSASSTVV
jgi:16S rRNA (adenine1518-N6/adenine1519-N6)-dimethyltransferase